MKIVPIPFLDKIIDFSCCMIDLNYFIEETSEVDLVTKNGRYEKTLPVEAEELFLPKKIKC